MVGGLTWGRFRGVAFSGAFGNLCLWGGMIALNVDVTQSVVTEGCNAVTGTCAVTDTVLTLFNATPKVSGSLLFGMFGVFMLAISFLLLYLIAKA